MRQVTDLKELQKIQLNILWNLIDSVKNII